MITCPYCSTINQSGAKFCSKCGTMLDNLPAEKNTAPSVQIGSPVKEASSGPSKVSPAKPLKPVAEIIQPNPTLPSKKVDEFRPRPVGAIFGGSFLYDSLRYKDPLEIRYTVTKKTGSAGLPFRICGNPNCGAFHQPLGDKLEQFCTQCGSPLQPSDPLFLLQEARQPIFGAAAEIVKQSGRLAHPNLRAPLAYFTEKLGNETRSCLVTPTYSQFPDHLDPAIVLPWGIEVALGLDYLHKNKLAYGGQIDRTCFGLDGTRPVWANFTRCNVPPEMVPQAQAADIRALAYQIFQWLTGKEQYGFEPNLPAAINRFFNEALMGKGYETGEALAQAIETAQSDSVAQQSINYRLGRCTDVGLERNLNEDSLVTVEFNRMLQSISQPLGFYAVADGMGGHSAGEIASGTIINTIAQRAATLNPLQPVSPDERLKWLKETVEAANKAVYDLRKSAGTDMGSTLVIALLDGVQATLAHAGDSRIYRLDAEKIQQLTCDHSLVERLIAAGQITREEGRYHPQRNVVYRTIGDKLSLEIDTSTHILAPGDRLLLCSDGLSGMLDDRNIHKIVMSASSPQEACEQLIAAANAAGGEDNITAVVIQIEAV